MRFRLQFIFAFTSEIAFLAVRACFQRTIRRGLVCSARRPRYRAPYREEVPVYLESVNLARHPVAFFGVTRSTKREEIAAALARKYARIKQVNRDRRLLFQGNALLKEENPEPSDLIEDRRFLAGTRVSAGERKRKENFRRRRI